jgi:hypothetical protein
MVTKLPVLYLTCMMDFTFAVYAFEPLDVKRDRMESEVVNHDCEYLNKAWRKESF